MEEAMNCKEGETTSIFGLTETWFGDVAVVGVSGELDMLTTPELAEAIEAAVRKSPSALIVDLSAVEFLASAGMSTLITAHEGITPRAKFAVVADGPATSRALRLVGIDQIFAVYRTLDGALVGVA
jgi:anti-sigma B factor antagonist